FEEIIFNKLSRLRSIKNHPFNSSFLKELLSGISISKRDTTWTEWLRYSFKERIKDILLSENKWKNNFNDCNEVDSLNSIWLMYCLSSTVRKLRDHATRALYWYGRGNP